MFKQSFFATIFVSLSLPVLAAELSTPNVFSPGDAISAETMNQNFSAIQTAVNDNNLKLTDALTDLEAVETASEEAQTTAQSAQTSASAAEASASTALTNANNALSVAANAQSSANAAQTTADDAAQSAFEAEVAGVAGFQKATELEGRVQTNEVDIQDLLNRIEELEAILAGENKAGSYKVAVLSSTIDVQSEVQGDGTNDFRVGGSSVIGSGTIFVDESGNCTGTVTLSGGEGKLRLENSNSFGTGNTGELEVEKRVITENNVSISAFGDFNCVAISYDGSTLVGTSQFTDSVGTGSFLFVGVKQNIED